MCRHLAYLGEPVRLGTLLTDPEHGLIRQSWAPRAQQHGTVNVDGFGIGWYADGDPIPARHRGAGPIWADATVADLARVISTRAVLAAVRSATPGMAQGLSAAAPFADGPWLFSHNGVIGGWPGSVADLASGLPVEDLARLDAATDSALLWALIRHRLRQGEPPAKALAAVVTAVAERAESRLSVLIVDGDQIIAAALGEVMVTRRLAAGVVVASEAWDDEDVWQLVPDATVMTLTPSATTVVAL